VLVFVGAYSIYDPPASLLLEMGEYAKTVTASLVMVGALFGAASALQGWRVVERLGIAMLLAGSSLYLSIMLIMQFTGYGNWLLQAGFIKFAMVSLISRWVRIRDRVFEPGSRASRRAQQKHPSITPTTGELPIADNDH